MMRNQKGFTLIELLIVVVIIGILAAIAIPKFSATRERAYVSQMKSDLRNLQTAQELYYSDPANNFTYASDLNDLTDFARSAGVNITVEEGDQTGWSAVAEHEAKPKTGDTEIKCAIYVGAVGAPEGAPENLPAGVVGCTGETFSASTTE